MLKNLIIRSSSSKPSSILCKYHLSNSFLQINNSKSIQMRKIHKYTDEELKVELAKIPSWELHQETNRNVIRKNFVFKDFKQAWAFMNKVAEKADQVSNNILTRMNSNSSS